MKKYMEDYRKRNREHLKQKHKEYRLNHSEKIRGYNLQYKKKNKERFTEYNKNYARIYRKKCFQRARLYQKNYRNLKRDHLSFKRREKLRNNPTFRISCVLRSRLREVLESYADGKKYKSEKYGINYNKIIEHLKPFPQDFSKYHIDHIKPLCSFDLTDPEQVKIAFAPQNHQWLLAKDNLKKGKKVLS